MCDPLQKIWREHPTFEPLMDSGLADTEHSGNKMQIKTTLILAAALALTACSSGTDSKTAKEPAAAPAAESTASPKTETPAEASYANLAEAIVGIRPTMTDTSNEISTGAVSMALWSADNLKWSELQALPKTKASLVMKDSEEQRGKLICATGNIIEIASEKAEGKKFFEGGLYDANGTVFRFIAVKSSGELVEQSHSTICGVVIGKQDYSNSMGGVAHAVFLVGMFKLPENTKA